MFAAVACGMVIGVPFYLVARALEFAVPLVMWFAPAALGTMIAVVALYPKNKFEV
ncbi:MAG: hypothetical protein IT464_12270 [Planctomycetes bacterium]|nr:hypothetical protein [Planctomycetota bacterium]